MSLLVQMPDAGTAVDYAANGGLMGCWGVVQVDFTIV